MLCTSCLGWYVSCHINVKVCSYLLSEFCMLPASKLKVHACNFLVAATPVLEGRGASRTASLTHSSKTGSLCSHRQAIATMAAVAPTRGAFIVFEGIDRCGKTTQSSKLMDYLKDKQIAAELWRFPDRSAATGPAINSYLASGTDLSDEAIHLLFSANRWEKKQALLEKLQAGITLVVDRYAHSGVAYSVAKQRASMDLQWCKAPDVGLPAPDCVLYMQLTPEASAKRGGYGGERYEKQAFQHQVAKAYEQLKDPLWTCIDADRSPDEVHKEVASAVEKVLERVAAGQPLLRLWDGQPVNLTSGSDPTRTTGDATAKVAVASPASKHMQGPTSSSPAATTACE